MVRRLRGADRIDGDAHVAVGTVLEADRTRQTGSQFAMHLRFGRARADGAPGDQVGRVLRRNRVEKLGRARQAQLVDFEQQAARQAQSFVDAKAVVETRVVDQPFPANRRARLLEVDAHDDQEILLEARHLCLQLARVFHRLLDVVDRTRPDDDQQAIIRTVQDAVDRLTRAMRRLRRLNTDRKLAKHVRRRHQFLDFLDTQVVGVRFADQVH